MQTLLNQLDDFYNPVLTPPGKDATEFVRRIPSMVEVGELKQFLIEVARIRKKYHVRDFASFFLNCYDNFDGAYRDELKWIVENDETLMEKVLESALERVLTFVTTPEKIRKMWRNDSFGMFYNGSAVVAHLMEAGKMSDSDIDDYFGKVLSDLYRYGNSWNEEEWVTEAFKKHGLFKKFLSEYFDVSFTSNASNMSRICHSVSFYASMMHGMDIESDDEYVRHIVEVFGTSYPYTLRDWFKREKMSDEGFATKLRQRVSQLGLEMPKSIEYVKKTDETEEEQTD